MTRRRVRRNAAQVRAILSEFRDSGLSRAEFCLESGYNEGSFGRWVRRFGLPDRDSERSLIPVKLTTTPSPTLIEIRLSNGRELRVPESIGADSLVRIVEALERC